MHTVHLEIISTVFLWRHRRSNSYHDEPLSGFSEVLIVPVIHVQSSVHTKYWASSLLRRVHPPRLALSGKGSGAGETVTLGASP